MRTIVILAGSVFLVAAFAGCTGSDGSPRAASSPAVTQGTTAVASSPSADTGTIHGNVTDDERLPVANATVALLMLDVKVLSAADGTFTFTNVPAGEHDVVTQKLGYESSGKKVTVAAGQASTVQFMLTSISVEKASFPEVLNHRAQYVISVTQYSHWALNYSVCQVSCQQTTCEGCSWTVRTASPADFMMVEDFGQHAVANPRGDTEFIWAFQKTYDGGTQVGGNSVIKLPGNITWKKDELGAKETTWWLQVLCDPNWFCYSEPRDVWVTLFHNTDEIPAGYSAKPIA